MSSTRNGSGGRHGRQEPRISLVPDYVSTYGDEAIALAAMAGLGLLPWQQLVLRQSLGEDVRGKWAAFDVACVVARQNGKNSVLEARELAELYLVSRVSGPRVILHSAHLFDTAIEHYRRMEARIRDTPELLARVKHRGSRVTGFNQSHGRESIELEDGSRLLFGARSKGGRRGFTADLLVFDEAWNLPEEFMGAVAFAVSAKTGDQFLPGPQIWATSSAVDQQKDPHGIVLARLRERAIRGDDAALAYFEWSAPDGIDPADREGWRMANPSMGTLITEEHVAIEFASFPARAFAVERNGQGDWPSGDPESARVISAEQWNGLADPGSRIVGTPTFAIDVDPDQAWATIGAAGETADGLYHVGVVDHRRGTEWVVPRLGELLRDHDAAQVIVDPRAETHALLLDLDEANVLPVRMTAGDYAEACGGFFLVVAEKRLRYMPPQPELDAAVAGARTRPLLDAWKWSRKDSGVVITPLVAVTLALWGARTQGSPQVWSIAEAVQRLRENELDEPLVV